MSNCYVPFFSVSFHLYFLSLFFSSINVFYVADFFFRVVFLSFFCSDLFLSLSDLLYLDLSCSVHGLSSFLLYYRQLYLLSFSLFSSLLLFVFFFVSHLIISIFFYCPGFFLLLILFSSCHFMIHLFLCSSSFTFFHSPICFKSSLNIRFLSASYLSVFNCLSRIRIIFLSLTFFLLSLLSFLSLLLPQQSYSFPCYSS